MGLVVETINETGQLFVGQQSGLVMMTRTAHPLKFGTYADQTAVGSAQPSMQILGTGSRDIQILTPLKCSGILSTFDNSVSIGGSLPSTTNCLSVIGGSTFGGQIQLLILKLQEV